MKTAILLALIWVIWLISPDRWRRYLMILIAVLLSYWVIVSPVGIAIATQGLIATLPADPGNAVEAIVVLGRGDDLRDLRIETVEQLWWERRAPKIFASGMLDAEFMLETFRDDGISNQALSGERCSQSTAENALFTSAILHSQEIRNIILVTDQLHMRRAVLSFQSSGFNVTPHVSSLPFQLNSKEYLGLLVREYAGLAKYTLMGQFRQRSEFELKHPPADVTRKLIDWNCKL